MAQQGTGFVCAIKSCEQPDGSAYFKFPNPEKHVKLFMDWIAATGDETLLDHHPLETFYTRRVCQKHFEEKYYGDEARPVPYLEVPTPIDVPSTWIISMIAPLEIDYQCTQASIAYLESDIIETSGFINYSYSTCGVENWFFYRNMFMIAENSSTDDDEDFGEFGLWSVPRNTLKSDPDEGSAIRGGNIERIRKSVHYILTSPTEYYSLKFKSLMGLHKRASQEGEKLRTENRILKRRLREMKKMLYMKHIHNSE